MQQVLIFHAVGTGPGGDIHRPGGVLQAAVLLPFQKAVLAGRNAERVRDDLQNAVILVRHPRLRLVLAYALDVQMTAEKQGQAVFLKQIDYLCVVLHRALGRVHAALVQQVVVGDGEHKHPLLLSLGQNPVHPGECALLKPPLHPVHRVVLSGIQHQHPVPLIQGIRIAQGILIPAERLIVSVFAVNLIEFTGIHRLRRSPGIPVKYRRVMIVDIVIPWDNQYLYPGLLHPFQTLRQLLMVDLLSVHGDISAEHQGRRPLCDHLV